MIGSSQQPTIVYGTEHVDPQRRAERVDEVAGRRPGNRRERSGRRETELAPALELTRHHPRRIGVEHGVEHRMMWIASLHHEPAALFSCSEDAGGPSQEGHRLLARAIPGREQLLVEIDKRDHADVGRRLVQ